MQTFRPLQIIRESLASRASPYKGSLNVNILAAKPNTILMPEVRVAGRYMLKNKFWKKHIFKSTMFEKLYFYLNCRMSPKWNIYSILNNLFS